MHPPRRILIHIFQLIKKSPKERRRFIDIELCQFNKLYYYALKQYYKVLKQRNNALKQYQQNPNPDMLDIWDMQYVEYAKEVIQRRSEFIQEINEVAKKIHANISGGKEDLEVVYEPNVLEANIEEKVARYRQKDIMTQSSSVGPHRDDLKFLINGMDVKVYGSQGQQRTVVLSMKLAELRLMQENLGEAPILLLDDVLSELDDSRQK